MKGEHWLTERERENLVAFGVSVDPQRVRWDALKRELVLVAYMSEPEQESEVD